MAVFSKFAVSVAAAAVGYEEEHCGTASALQMKVLQEKNQVALFDDPFAVSGPMAQSSSNSAQIGYSIKNAIHAGREHPGHETGISVQAGGMNAKFLGEEDDRVMMKSTVAEFLGKLSLGGSPPKTVSENLPQFTALIDKIMKQGIPGELLEKLREEWKEIMGKSKHVKLNAGAVSQMKDVLKAGTDEEFSRRLEGLLETPEAMAARQTDRNSPGGDNVEKVACDKTQGQCSAKAAKKKMKNEKQMLVAAVFEGFFGVGFLLFLGLMWYWFCSPCAAAAKRREDERNRAEVQRTVDQAFAH